MIKKNIISTRWLTRLFSNMSMTHPGRDLIIWNLANAAARPFESQVKKNKTFKLKKSSDAELVRHCISMIQHAQSVENGLCYSTM